MDVGGVKRFVRDRRELEAFRERAKLHPCPHCQCVGALNAHGSVSGYAEVGSERVARGHRFFCSNRHRRPGCGRTFTLWLADVLRCCVVRTATLWRFLSAIAGGQSRQAAWQLSGGSVLSTRSGYRLCDRFARAGPRLRSLLSSLCPPPTSTSPLPIAQLIDHLRLALLAEPLSAFQYRFQIDLLG